jgi:hypothetical protein
MNQGVATTQAALEISLAREAINSQAEALRFIHNAYVSKGANKELGKKWTEITRVPSGGVKTGSEICLSDYTDKSRLFFINPSNVSVLGQAAITDAAVFPEVVDDVARGIWIETAEVKVAAPGGGTSIVAYDFYIRACWQAPNTNNKTTLSTIVRLYVPGANV